ncbi:hypothetical protein Tco_0052186 [Tanacetum coccineum]
MLVLDKIEDEPLVSDEQLMVDMIDNERVYHKTGAEEVNKIVEQLVRAVDDIEIECCTEVDDWCSMEV